MTEGMDEEGATIIERNDTSVRSSRGHTKAQIVLHPPRLVEMTVNEYEEAVQLLATLVGSYIRRHPLPRISTKENPDAYPREASRDALKSNGPSGRNTRTARKTERAGRNISVSTASGSSSGDAPSFGGAGLLSDAIQVWRTRAEKKPSRDEQIAALTATTRRKEQLIERYLRAFEMGTLPEEECGDRVRSLSKAVDALRAERERLLTAHDSKAPEADPLAEMDLSAFLRVVLDAKEDLPVAKALLRILIGEVRVDGREIYPTFRLPPRRT